MSIQFHYKLKRKINYIKNYFFVKKYPFYKFGNSFEFTWYEMIPYGWRKAFGKKLSKELSKTIKSLIKKSAVNICWQDLITFCDIKEKCGTLRLDVSAVKELRHICRKYELLSSFYCINCGRPSKYMTLKWTEYYCERCFKKNVAKISPNNYIKLGESDIPHVYITNKNGKSYRVDLKKEYNIDVKKLIKKR